MPAKSNTGAIAEKYNGMYSARCRKPFTEWARKISKVRKPKLSRTKTSRTVSGPNQSRLSLSGTAPPQIGGHGFKVDLLSQHGVVAVPLHEVSTSHERSMLRGAAVVMPEVEIYEINRLGEGRRLNQTIVPQAIHQCLGP